MTTTAPAVFDFAALTREVIAASASPDPGNIAADLLDKIPAAEYQAVLSSLLRDHVRRSLPLYPAASASAAATPKGVSPRPRGSWKLSVGEQWRRRSVFVGDHTWKFLKDCTYDDLMANAAVKRGLADATLREAEKSEALAELVKRTRGASTLGDVPSDKVLAVLAGGAS